MIEAMKQALEALKDVGILTDREWQAVHKNKANELRQAIAELESQEPVGEVDAIGLNDTDFHVSFKKPMPLGTKLYTHPPQRTEQEPVAWRELCRRLYVELFHCDQQMMAALDEDGYPIWQQGKTVRDVLTDAKTALETFPPQRTEQEPVQVSPLEFVEMVMEKEHLIGKPIFWAEWPNKEKNT